MFRIPRPLTWLPAVLWPWCARRGTAVRLSGEPAAGADRAAGGLLWWLWPLAVLSLFLPVAGGCARLRVPRIDPTGERVFIWPRNQVPPVAPGNNRTVAPPVFTDPVFPQPTPATGVPVPGAAVAPSPPQDRLTIRPQRVLAPVGSEVILKAGLCTAENFLLTDTKTDWLLARDTAGEFVELGGRGWCRRPLLPWNKPKKIDNQYAVGYSASVPLTITRGTADTSDDVQVEPGEAWATITSPVEGTSHITAVAPEVVAWSGRRATATIYWVDVRWTFPPATLSASGSQVLTTTVVRQTDATPLEGWLVRYQVAGGEAPGASGQFVEVPTDAQGEASIDVNPTGGAGTRSTIQLELVRPPRWGGSDMPRLVVAQGTSSIEWTDGGTPYLPPPSDLGNVPPPSLPPARPAPPPVSPTPAPTPAPPIPLRPTLELEVRGAGQTEVGQQARFEVVIRNTGDAAATRVVLNDRFDEGLSHLADPGRALEIENTGIGDIAAGGSYTDYLSFNVLQAGRLCHDVTVRCAEGAQTQKRVCITSVQPLPQKQPGVEVQKSGPQQQEVGQMAQFTLTIRNTGEVPLTSLEVVDEYDPSLLPQPAQQGFRMANNTVVWNLPRLEVGATKRLDVNCQCVAPRQQACSTVQVSANTGTASGTISTADRHCIEILPGRDVVPPGGPAVPPRGNVVPPSAVPPSRNVVPPSVPPPSASQASGLQLDVLSLSNNPVRAGSLGKYEIVLKNNSASSDDQVQLRVQFPPGILPDPTSVLSSGNIRAQRVGNELVFDNIAQIRAQERLTFTVQANITQQGIGNIVARARSRKQPQPIQKALPVEVIR